MFSVIIFRYKHGIFQFVGHKLYSITIYIKIFFLLSVANNILRLLPLEYLLFLRHYLPFVVFLCIYFVFSALVLIYNWHKSTSK
jgi:hypothetical protein